MHQRLCLLVRAMTLRLDSDTVNIEEPLEETTRETAQETSLRHPVDDETPRGENCTIPGFHNVPPAAPWLQSASSKPRRSKELPVLERHDLFASTVMLGADRFQVSRSQFSEAAQASIQSWPGVSGSLSSRDQSGSISARDTSALRTPRPGTWGGSGSQYLAPTAWRAPKSARINRDMDSSSMLERSSLLDSRTDLMSIDSSRRGAPSVVSCGVPVHISRLHRVDGIPDRETGRRAGHKGAHGESDIRIFIRLPGGSRFALWVPPDIVVGPLDPPSEGSSESLPSFLRRFTKSEEGSLGDGRLTPLRSLLAQRSEGSDQFKDTSLFEGNVPFSLDMIGTQSEVSSDESPRKQQSSLKNLIEAATGIDAKRQRLVIGRRGPLEDPKKPIHTYDIGHGATLYLSIKNAGTRAEVQFLASPALKQSHDVHTPWEHMERFMRSTATVGNRVAKDVVEPLPDWRVSFERRALAPLEYPSEMYYKDYTFLRDNHIFDLTGRIRKRFEDKPAAASKRMTEEQRQHENAALRVMRKSVLEQAVY